MIKLEILKDNKIIDSAESNDTVEITASSGAWDKINLITDLKYVSFEMVGIAYESIIYLTDGTFSFDFPNVERLRGFETGAFDKDIKIIARPATCEYRDLALNPYDMFIPEEVTPWDAPEWANPIYSKAVQDGKIKAFPHAYASRVTRDEGCFYARNAIDGKSGIGSHGDYPYNSWGGGVHDDLSIAVYFGRPVTVDKLLLNLRSDYTIENGLEHDTYWKSATLEFDDGSELVVSPQKTEKDQIFEFDKKTTTYVVLKNLVPYVNPQGMNFAALNRIGVFGIEA